MRKGCARNTLRASRKKSPAVKRAQHSPGTTQILLAGVAAEMKKSRKLVTKQPNSTKKGAAKSGTILKKDADRKVTVISP